MKILALDCGGTKSRALLIEDGRLLGEHDLPGVNLQSHGADAVAQVVAAGLMELPDAEAVALSLAGLRTEQERHAVLQALGRVVVDRPVMLFADVLAALRSGGLDAGIALVAGTGSAAYARGTDEREAQAGGWGHRIGDEGSGYWMGREALSMVVRAHDSGESKCTVLEDHVLAHLGVTQVDDLRRFAGSANAVARIAGLAPVLGRLYAESDPIARDIADRAAVELSRLVRLAARKVSLPEPRPVVLAGGVFQSLPQLERLIANTLGTGFSVSRLDVDPAWGAYWLAVESDRWTRPESRDALLVTEHENPASVGFSALSTTEQAKLMNVEDARVAPAVARALPEIARLVDAVVERLSAGGRLIYVGAGTSGRLAMLDAVECVPTFGIPPGMVVALVAGGHEALVRAIEGAEDVEQAGEDDLLALGPTAQDVVVGVTASGRAGYVFRAVQVAHQASCLTAVVLCNANAPVARMADLRILVDPGAEIIAGSTRLKAGTAQKLVLNMISTLTMARLGRTLDNRMIGVRPTNAKLRERSIGLVRELTSCRESEAEAALDRAEWNVPLAALSLHLGSLEAARRALTKSGMNVRDALLRAGLRPR